MKIYIFVVSSLVLAIVVKCCFFTYKNKRFTQEDWLEKSDERICLVKDLIQKKTVIGMSKLEVIDFLGYEFNGMRSNKWSYSIGSTGLFSFWRKQLFIYFNEGGFVVLVKKT